MLPGPRALRLLVLASLGVSLAIHYFDVVEYPFSERRLALHRQMLEHSAPSQLRHRILAPVVAEGVARVIALPLREPVRWTPEETGTLRPLMLGYIVLNIAAFSTALVALYLLLEGLYPAPWAFAGALLAAAAMPLTFVDQWYHPDSALELAFFAVALLLSIRRQPWWLLLVVLLAAFNRETSLFLVLALLFASWKDRRARSFAFGYVAAWAAVFVGLRVVHGFPPPTFTLAMAWAGNREHWIKAVILNAAFLGAFWLCFALGVRRASGQLMRATLVLPLYLGLLLVIGYWWEIRYWLSMLPLLIPIGLPGLGAGEESKEEIRAAA